MHNSSGQKRIAFLLKVARMVTIIIFSIELYANFLPKMVDENNFMDAPPITVCNIVRFYNGLIVARRGLLLLLLLIKLSQYYYYYYYCYYYYVRPGSLRFFIVSLVWQMRKEHPCGLLFCQSKPMDSIFIKELFVMAFVSVMAGDPPHYLHLVCVVFPSLWIMHSAVPMVASLFYDTMSFVTSQPNSLTKSAIT